MLIEVQEARRELELIKARINPHFLLNSLNNIYAISYRNSPQTNQAILQLSKVLSYTIYQNKHELIAIAEELESMLALAGLYQLKFNNQLSIEIAYDESVEASPFRIPSMVLFSLLENAIKHSGVSENKAGYIKQKLVVNDNTLIFSSENSISPPLKKETQMYSGGLGSEAIKKLLAHHFPNNFHLHTEKQSSKYITLLSINGLQT